MNYRKNNHTESLNYNIRGQYPHIVVKFQTDPMRIERENYEYHEQTKLTAQRETKNVDLIRFFCHLKRSGTHSEQSKINDQNLTKNT